MILRKPYTIVLISSILLSLFFLFPFINGLGCNFKYKSEDATLGVAGSCYLGVLSMMQHEKTTNSFLRRDALVGMWGDHLYSITIRKGYIAKNVDPSRMDIKPSYLSAEDYLEDLYRDKMFRTFYVQRSHIDDSTYVIVSEKPVNRIIKASVHGRFSFLDK